MNDIENRVEEIANVEEFVINALTPATIHGKMYETTNDFKTSGFDALDPDEYDGSIDEDECYDEEDDWENATCVEECEVMIEYDPDEKVWLAIDDGGVEVCGNSIGEVITNYVEEIESNLDHCGLWHGDVEYCFNTPKDDCDKDDIMCFATYLYARYLIEC